MSRNLAAVLSAVVVAVMIAVGVAQVRPPAPVDERAPAAAFSAARAGRHLARIALQPRPVGTAEHDRVRDYLRTALAESGFSAAIQRSAVVAPRDTHVAGVVENVVGRLAGSGDGAAILLAAHYDSVPTSPGAADDASGLAVLLEVARALRAGPPLSDDVVILFTDGEESYQLGANAFLESPLADRVGVVLHFDNAGSAGPSIMYETSGGNERLVAAYAHVGAPPVGTSLSDDLVRSRRIASDFIPLRDAGFPGMTFGLSEGFARNHTWRDTIDRVDPASLQHQGEQALTLVHHLGTGDLSTLRGAGDVVYFTVVGGRMIAYPQDWAVPLVGLTAAAFVAVFLFGWTRRRLRGSALLLGIVNGLLTLIFTSALLAAFWAFGWSATGDASSPGYASDIVPRVGLTLLFVGVGLALRFWLFEDEHVLEEALGTCVWWLALAAYVSLAQPARSYLLVWPLVATLAALAVVIALGCPRPTAERQSVACLVALWAGAAPTVLLFSASMAVLVRVRGMRLDVVVVGVWLVIAALLPLLALLRRRTRWLVAVLCAAVGAAGFVGLSPATGLGAEWTMPEQLVYRYDVNADAAYWGTFVPEGDVAAIRAAGREMKAGAPTGGDGAPAGPAFGRGPAPTVRLPAPRAMVVADRLVGGRRDLVLRLRGQPGAVFLTVLVDSDVGRLNATVDGLPLAGQDTRWPDGSGARWHFDYHVPPDGGVTLRLSVDRDRSLRFRLLGLHRGLPEAAALRQVPRPSRAGPAGVADLTEVQVAYALGPRVGAPLRLQKGP